LLCVSPPEEPVEPPLETPLDPAVEAVIERYIVWQELNQGASVHTTRQYRGHVRRLARWCQANGFELLHVERDALQAFVGPWLHKAGLGPVSRQQVVSAVRGFYRWCVSARLIQDDPASTLERPRAGRRLPTVMTLAAAERLMWAPDLETFLGVRDAAILGVLLGCGLRVAGVCALNERNLIWAKERGRESLTLKVLEKGDRDRLVPVPDEARLLLHLYLGHPDLATINRALPDGDQVLFVSTKNGLVPEHAYHGEARRIGHLAVRRLLLKHGKAAGLPREILHPHAARHLYGTELAESDVHLLAQQKLMGHVDPKSTEIYTHLAQRKLREAVERGNPLSKISTPVSDLAKRLR
jgi:integrase/recombinase XerD